MRQLFFGKNCHGLRKKEKLRIDCKKGALISILANKITTNDDLIIKESKQAIHYIYFLFSRYYVHIMFIS